MALINSSNWSPVEIITLENKATLLQDLVYTEIIDKRQNQLQHLRDGLNHFNVVDLCSTDPSKFRFLFVYQEDTLTCERMLNLISFDTQLQLTEDKAVACRWFKEYIQTRANEKIGNKCMIQ